MMSTVGIGDIVLKGLKHAVIKVKIANGLLPICANCKVICTEIAGCLTLETYMLDRPHAGFTHPVSRMECPN